MYPTLPKPMTVETSFGVDKKPAVLNPRCKPTVVERIDDVKDTEEIYPTVPRPATVEMKLLA